MRQIVSGTLPLSTESPRRFGIWPTMITTPMPLMKPRMHRPGEELRHEPEPERPASEEDDAGQHRERCEKRRVLLAREGRRDRRRAQRRR